MNRLLHSLFLASAASIAAGILLLAGLRLTLYLLARIFALGAMIIGGLLPMIILMVFVFAAVFFWRLRRM